MFEEVKMFIVMLVDYLFKLVNFDLKKVCVIFIWIVDNIRLIFLFLYIVIFDFFLFFFNVV